MLKLRYMISHRGNSGFALPTIVIASLILMMVLMAALSTTTSTRTALEGHYYSQLAREAAEAGVQMAYECYYKSVKTATSSQWPNAGTLDTGEDCFGAAIAGVDCAAAAPGCFVLNNNGLRTYYSASIIVDPSAPASVSVSAVGYIDKMRMASGGVAWTSEVNMKKKMAIDLYGLATGNDTSCAILSGKLYCWGRNDYGQVGNGDAARVNVNSPTLVQGALSGLYVHAVGTGIQHTCAIAGPLPTPAPGNAVYCWGDNSMYQYGISSTSSLVPKKTVVDTSLHTGSYAGSYFTAVSARDHTCVIVVTPAAEKRHWCWGDNNQQQAGEASDGTHPAPKTSPGLYLRDNSSTPVPVKNAVQINNVDNGLACGINGAAAYCMGNGDQGGLGDGRTSGDSDRVVYVTNMTSATKIATNNGRACAVNAGKLYCWGSNWDTATIDYRIDSGPAFATTGQNPLAKRVHTSVSPFFYNATIQDFAISDWSMCVIIANEVYCSGYNALGTLGQGYFTDVASGKATSPSQVVSANNALKVGGELSGKVVEKIVGGNNHFCAITDRRMVYCWGYNKYGQLGDGSTELVRTLPTRANTPIEVIY